MARKGNTIVRTIKGETKELTRQEIEYSSATFNPFDKENVKLASANMRKVFKENDGVTKATIGEGDASNL